MALPDDPIIILNPRTMTTFIVIHGASAYHAATLDEATVYAESLKSKDE